MNKKIFVLVVLVSVLFGVTRAQAFFLAPYFNITVNEHSVGGEGNFGFHIEAGSSYFNSDFNVQTASGEGTHFYSAITHNGDSYELTQVVPDGWQAPTITCSSANPAVTVDQITNGVWIHPASYSSITCDVTNTQGVSKTPVLIIPGVLGTDISDANGNKLWLDILHNVTDIGDQFMDPLQFNSDLKPSDLTLSLGNVVKKVGPPFAPFDYSEGIVNEFKSQGYTEGTTSSDNLFLFPYDWRYGVTGVNADGKTAPQLLGEKVAQIMAQTGSTKVDVVAHSTGGLIVKKYVMDNPTDNHIGKAVFVGVPNTGAPSAVKTLVFGDSFGDYFFLDPVEMKKISENLPVVYDLLPSREYFNNKGSYVKLITSDNRKTTTQDLNFDESKNFLQNDLSLNGQALTNADGLHSASFDNYDMRTAGVDTYAIDGCKAGTLGQVAVDRYTDIFGRTTTNYATPKFTPGDGTVPLESATNVPLNETNKYYALKADHGKMLSQEGIRQEIVNLVSGSTTSVDTSRITQDITKCKLNGRAMSVFSPLNISITDQDGNHSGLSSDGVSIENNIPNADFEIMGEHKFVYLPTDDGQTYNVSVQGTGAGTFTLKNAEISNDEVAQTEVFSNIPVTTALTGSVNLGVTTTLALDTKGDGTITTIAPTSVVDASASQDIVPPVTSASVAGTMGQPGFYRTDATITLSATDPVVIGQESLTSGILKTSYSVDGAGQQEYSSPIIVTTEGKHTITFFSTDKAGNNEEIQTLVFMIDKTAPEASIKFDMDKKDLNFSGTDNTSGQADIIVADNDDTITLTDQAGNVTLMKLKDKNRKKGMSAEIKSLSYNGKQADISKNKMAFSWKTESGKDKDDNRKENEKGDRNEDKNKKLIVLSQSVQSKKDYNILALYDGTNTKLTGRDATGKISKSLSGLTLLTVKTNQGDLTWGY